MIEEIDDDIRQQFTYQNNIPDEGRKNFARISAVLMEAAQVIRNCTPASADQTIALQHLVDARMRSNKAIAHQGKSFERPAPCGFNACHHEKRDHRGRETGRGIACAIEGCECTGFVVLI